MRTSKYLLIYIGIIFLYLVGCKKDDDVYTGPLPAIGDIKITGIGVSGDTVPPGGKANFSVPLSADAGLGKIEVRKNGNMLKKFPINLTGTSIVFTFSDTIHDLNEQAAYSFTVSDKNGHASVANHKVYGAKRVQCRPLNGKVFGSNGKYELLYDSLGHIISYASSSQNGSKPSRIRKYSYDNQGKLVSVRDSDDVNIETTMITLDAEGRIIQETFVPDWFEGNKKTIYEYNAEGYLVFRAEILGTDTSKAIKYTWTNGNMTGFSVKELGRTEYYTMKYTNRPNNNGAINFYEVPYYHYTIGISPYNMYGRQSANFIESVSFLNSTFTYTYYFNAKGYPNRADIASNECCDGATFYFEYLCP
ncbi:MAG: hypothetical protein V4543_13400 [Bacteroidota bacterium]